MNNKLYPLLFKPIYKESIWGGEKLKHLLNKSFTSNAIGESWELSGVEGFVSEVSNGEYSGKSLNALLDEFPSEILGNKVHQKLGTKFPLLFKYIDAHQDLSIQVHPNDELAFKRHHSYGKTELWYVLDADKKARIIAGFKEKSNTEEYLKHLKSKSLESILNTIYPKQGDAFMLDAGTVHAIGAGLVVAEIQQTSDITYRIYDFDRKDKDGNYRELHVDLALEAINYNKIDCQMKYSKIENQSNQILHCQYFTTNFIPLNNAIQVVKDGQSFTVYMCIEGNFELILNNVIYTFTKGDTVLIPAILKSYCIKGKASLLEIYISQ